MSTFAVCLACERRGGSSLASGWRQVLGWILVPILSLLALLLLLHVLVGGAGH